MSLPIEFQNDQFNITETPTGLTIAIGRELTGFTEVQESIRQLMMVALKFLLTEDLERETRQDAEDRESDIRDAVRREMEESRGVGAPGDDVANDPAGDIADDPAGDIMADVTNEHRDQMIDEPPPGDAGERDDRE